MAAAQDADLLYDDVTPIEEYAEPPSLEHRLSDDTGSVSLAARIGTTKAYFMPEIGANRPGKRKREEEKEDHVDDTEDTPTNTSIRENAILLNGTPISHLPTNNIFAYATHFDTKPTALEWIDDTTCILVFPTRTAARTAYSNMSKSSSEGILEDHFITAHPVPIALWPPEERINSSLGKGEGLKGIIRLRWATPWDVKQRGAKQQSEFYKRYGQTAGRDGDSSKGLVGKRRRRDVSEAEEKAELDQELDSFLTTEPEEALPSPPSKMRSDHIQSGGRSLLERFRPDLQSRLSSPTAHRGKVRNSRTWESGEGVEGSGELAGDSGDKSERNGRGRRGGERRGRNTRPKKTAEDLDAELDSFLEEGYSQD